MKVCCAFSGAMSEKQPQKKCSVTGEVGKCSEPTEQNFNRENTL